MNKRVTWGVAALFGAVAISGALVGRDVLALETAFEASKKELKAVQTHLTSADLAAARASASAATEHAQTTARRSDGPLWAVLSVAPYTRGSVTTLRAASELAAASADAAVAVSEGGEALFNDDGTLRVEIANGQVNLGVLDEAGMVLDQIPVDRLTAAIEALEATGEGWWVPGRVAQEREGALELSSKVLEDLETARLATDALPGWLGADGPRRYLLAFQNPAELRATGGFLGFLGVLEVDNGRFSLGESLGVEPLSDEAPDGIIRRNQVENLRLPPVPAPADFASRYDPMAGRSFFGSTNLDPDFPTVAGVMLELWSARVGQRLDGVIAADPVLLRDVLRVVGPLVVPREVNHRELPRELRANNVIQTLLVDAYDAFGGRSRERMLYHQIVAREAFGVVFGGDWAPRGMLEALNGAAKRHHLQLFSTDADEQALWSRIQADGNFKPSGTNTDFLGVTFINTGANKADIHAERSIDVTYELLDVDTSLMMAHRRVTATVEIKNNLVAGDHDPYIINSAFPQPLGTTRRFDDRLALNRNWFTVWSLGGSLLQESTVQGVEGGIGRQRMHGLSTFDGEMQTESLTTSTAVIVYHGWVPLGGTPQQPTLTIDWQPPRLASPFTAELSLVPHSAWLGSWTSRALPSDRVSQLVLVLTAQSPASFEQS